MNTIFSGILAALIPTRGTFYFVVGSFVAGMLSSAYIIHKFHDAETVTAVNNARSKEIGAASIGNKNETILLDQLRRGKDDADKRANLLQALLKNQPVCRVNPDVVRLLNESTVPDPSRTTASVKTTAAPIETDCKDVITRAANNYQNVCNANALQLTQLQLFYNDLRNCYNEKSRFDNSCASLVK